MKTQLKKTTDKKKREVVISRIHIMNEHIELQQEKTEANRIARIVEQLKEKNRSQERKIWEIKRKV